MTKDFVRETLVIRPAGDLCEGDECDQLERALAEQARLGRSVVVDLSGTRFLTAHALGVLARAHRIGLEHGARIALCGVTGTERWLLALTHLSEALPVYADETAAVAHLGEQRAVA